MTDRKHCITWPVYHATDIFSYCGSRYFICFPVKSPKIPMWKSQQEAQHQKMQDKLVSTASENLRSQSDAYNLNVRSLQPCFPFDPTLTTLPNEAISHDPDSVN